MAIIKQIPVIRPIPHGANPDDYVAVNTEKGILYRRKRKKGSVLNTVCKLNQQKLEIASAESRKIRLALYAIIEKKLRRTLHYRINSALMKSLKHDSMVNLKWLNHFKLMDEPIKSQTKRLQIVYHVRIVDDSFILKFPYLPQKEDLFKLNKYLDSLKYTVLLIQFISDKDTYEVVAETSNTFNLDEEFNGWDFTQPLLHSANYLLCLKVEGMHGEFIINEDKTKFIEIALAGHKS